MSEIVMLSAAQLVAGFRQCTLSPVEVMCEVLDRITKLDPVVNAFCALDEEGAMSAAGEAERRWMRGEPCGPLDGVPVSVKDLVAVAGLPTRQGSWTASPDRESADAPAVARLRRAGAIPFGKTTTSEFGNKIVTDCPLTGATRNPWDTRLSPGGSSGGSAVAVALGMGPLSLATDGGGSIRIPACWSGVVGFKPTFALVPAGSAASWTALSTLGPITRTVRDAALMLDAMTCTNTCANSDGPPGTGRTSAYSAGLDDGVAGLRIAWCAAPDGVSVALDIAECVGRAVDTFGMLGAMVIQTDVAPVVDYYRDGRIHSVQWSVFFAQRVRHTEAADRTLLDPDLTALADAGARIDTATFVDALLARHALGASMETFFEHYDLLVTPTFHCGPPAVPGLPGHLRNAPLLTAWCNQAGVPAISVPCGFAGDVPTGLQIIGRRGSDALVLRAARAYELARGDFPAPEGDLPLPGDTEIAP
ncbi:MULTISPECIES: amidase family protein [Burkholderia cepacia complex]|uniref:Acylamidase n=1 Tax=Burkholderia pseudomultivorans TaxID=1207504 RepID=A0ABU2E5C9_9BURK|nr:MULTISPECIES: amidase family protein [Burkholderia cepacia complex]MDN8068953.1 amidase family protein [Burkholderia vietnamiensis]MDR8730066.1 Acylamidase [Burkholderia pseudomultivorans]MDR8737488.1 Acylamidase [Burkholderia pseudomultivorans]MDR8743803.1 Acylamidase [Burkholderia pseudomultivorans]MDR8755083.1 Acylamidase [Burkholderia pseudomultivorans]